MRNLTLFLVVSLVLHISHGSAQSFTNYTVASTSTQLPSNDVRTIAIDAQDNKWFGTEHGVSKIPGGTQGINHITNKNQLNLYPNPVQDVLYINLSEKQGMLELFDIAVKSVLQNEILENKASIDVSGLENGIYLVKVLSDKKMVTGKFVKQ